MTLGKGCALVLAVLLASPLAVPQNPSSSPQQVPDAPSATRPAHPFPQDIPPRSVPEPPPQKPAEPPAEPKDRGVAVDPDGHPVSPIDKIDSDIIVTVNAVFVPVTVKDTSGRMVDGLVAGDFAVFENDEEQEIRFFTSDPFPLSAAVVLDTSLPEVTMRKIRDTYPSLAGAFSQYDEVALYTFGNTVNRPLDFRAAGGDVFLNTLRRTRSQDRLAPVPVTGGPLGQAGPTVSGRPLDPGQPRVQAPRRESHVLNDAILQAALDLSQRARGRRKVIFVISEGMEDGSTASYEDVLKVLLSNEITVYGVAVGGSAIPGYGDLQKFRIPGVGPSLVLPKFASATGGEVFEEFSAKAMDTAYARLTDVARNQYTLGYTSRSRGLGYRSIEVRVYREGLKIYARDGYFPLPPPAR
jgi:VWFA-related protein